MRILLTSFGVAESVLPQPIPPPTRLRGTHSSLHGDLTDANVISLRDLTPPLSYEQMPPVDMRAVHNRFMPDYATIVLAGRWMRSRVRALMRNVEVSRPQRSSPSPGPSGLATENTTIRNTGTANPAQVPCSMYRASALRKPRPTSTQACSSVSIAHLPSGPADPTG